MKLCCTIMCTHVVVELFVVCDRAETVKQEGVGLGGLVLPSDSNRSKLKLFSRSHGYGCMPALCKRCSEWKQGSYKKQTSNTENKTHIHTYIYVCMYIHVSTYMYVCV